jgi:hypothetical protein
MPSTHDIRNRVWQALIAPDANSIRLADHHMSGLHRERSTHRPVLFCSGVYRSAKRFKAARRRLETSLIADSVIGLFLETVEPVPTATNSPVFALRATQPPFTGVFLIVVVMCFPIPRGKLPIASISLLRLRCTSSFPEENSQNKKPPPIYRQGLFCSPRCGPQVF